jgi:hypothetical protein
MEMIRFEGILLNQAELEYNQKHDLVEHERHKVVLDDD